MKTAQGFVPYVFCNKLWAAVGRNGYVWFSEMSISEYCTYNSLEEAIQAIRNYDRLQENREVWSE
jgi:hypothetical protein